LTVSGICTRIGRGRRSRLEPPEPPNRSERGAAGRAAAHGRKEAGQDQCSWRRAPRHRPPGGASSSSAPSAWARPAGSSGPGGWDPTRLASVEVPDDEKGPNAAGFLQAGGGVLPSARDHHPARDERERSGLPIGHPRGGAPSAQAQAPANPGPPAPHQRQGETLHQDTAPPAGPTAPFTARQPNDEPRSPAGLTGRTPDDHTAPSATSHRQLASTS